MAIHFVVFFFFSSRRRHTRFDCDWSSDVCSSDLQLELEIEDIELGGVRIEPAAFRQREPRSVFGVIAREAALGGELGREKAAGGAGGGEAFERHIAPHALAILLAVNELAQGESHGGL